MVVTFRIEVALIVTAINSAANKVHVGFVFGLRSFRVASPCSILVPLSLPDVLLHGGAYERDPLSVGRPDRIRGAFGQVGNGPGFTSGERKDGELTGLG